MPSCSTRFLPTFHTAALTLALALSLAACGDSPNNTADPTAPETAPLASVAPAQDVATGTALTFDASASTGDALQFEWTLVSRPPGSAATIGAADTARPTFVPDVPGTYVATVVVRNRTSSSTATVTVVAADAIGFDTVPAVFPPSYASLGFQASAVQSVGDQATLAPGTPRTLAGMVVGMSSWACETGSWSTGCLTTPGSGYAHPVTVRFYNDSGVLLGSKTQTFTMPFRPSSDPTCGSPTQWKNASGTCSNGFAFKIEFDLRSLRIAVPDSFYYEIALSTNTWGPSPIGVSGPYDSLNIGLYDALTASPSVGTDPKPGIMRLNGADAPRNQGLFVQMKLAAP
jgi:hypothetical protein